MVSRYLIFIREWGNLNVYRKLYNYIQYVFTKLSIPFQVFDTLQDCEQRYKDQWVQNLVFLPFDALCQMYRDKQKDLPCIRNIRYIYMITEPNHNLEGVMDICSKNMESIYAVLNFNMNQEDLIARLFPNKPQFYCLQGYIPTEDFSGTVSESERTIDVLAPGFAGSSDDRKAVVAELRSRGLTVKDDTVYHDELNKTIRTCKIAITYPFNKQYDIWYGQRTLWAINKQTCVVAVPSNDTRAEHFYAGLAVNVNREQFVETVVKMIQSGLWKSHGIQSYNRFKKDYFCTDVFNTKLSDFCRRWTSQSI
jgi:hypothetical protein